MLTMLPVLMIIKIQAATLCLWALTSSYGLLQSKKLYLVPLLIESKYKVVANGAAELSWIGSLLRELNIAPTLFLASTMTTLVPTMTANPVFHGRTKHIEIDFHFVREKVFHKTLTMLYTPSVDQLADCLTKALPVQRFLHFRNKLTVLTRPLSLRGTDK